MTFFPAHRWGEPDQHPHRQQSTIGRAWWDRTRAAKRRGPAYCVRRDL